MYIRNNIHVILHHEAVINFYVLKPIVIIFEKKKNKSCELSLLFFQYIGTTKINYLSLKIRDFEIIRTFFV